MPDGACQQIKQARKLRPDDKIRGQVGCGLIGHFKAAYPIFRRGFQIFVDRLAKRKVQFLLINGLSFAHQVAQTLQLFLLPHLPKVLLLRQVRLKTRNSDAIAISHSNMSEEETNAD